MKHIPNILSGFRILLIPVFIIFTVQNNMVAAAVVLLVSGVTDILDGFLARRFGWVSDFGKVLDPAADKLTQIAVCVVMVMKLRQYWPIFAIFLLKEAVMLVVGGYLLKKGVHLEGAKWFGKISTFTFYGVMIILLFFSTIPQYMQLIMLVVALTLSITAGLLYIPDYLRYRKNIKVGKRGQHQSQAEWDNKTAG